MTLFYAVGGGMGHVSRSISLARQLSIKHYKIITALDLADQVVPSENLIILHKDLQEDLAALKSYLLDLMDSLSPNSVYIDSFPFGILGELRGFSWPANIRKIYVARLIQWGKYIEMFPGDLLNFNEVVVMEDLYESHLGALEKHYVLRPVSLVKEELPGKTLGNSGFSVICHSGNDQELDELCSFALEIKTIRKSTSQLFLVSPQKPADLNSQIEWLSSGLARKYFEHAEFIVTACGFNLMNECSHYKSKHYFIPFERKFDDQFFRADIYRRKTDI